MVDAVPHLLHPFARPAATDFVTIVRGEGAAVFDADGNRYVDALASLWYCNVGHGRAEVVDAITAQLGSLEAFHTFERFTNPPADALAAQLVAIAPMDGARVFLVNSGSEAVDTAMKLARLAHGLRGEPQRTVIVARRFGYHGVTYGGVSAQGIEPNRAGFGPLLPDVVHVDHDDAAALDAVVDELGDRIAAVIAEPVIGAGGIHPPPDGYLDAARAACDRAGAFLILDEVICGFGRLGTWWGAERYGVRPDLVTFAKGVTAGYVPLGGVLVGPAVRAPLEADDAFVLRHGHTYSGHPTAAAAGVAVLDVLEREGLLARATAVGDRLRAGLDALVADGLLTGVRGAGAVWAALVDDGTAVAVRDAMLPHGVLARPLGTDVVGFCPPLVIEDADVDRCVEAIAAAVRAVRSGA